MLVGVHASLGQTFSCPLSSISRDQALIPTLVGSKHMNTEASYSDPENGGSLYVRNVGSTVHFHTTQRYKNKMKAS
jgi:hypothetical protein